MKVPVGWLKEFVQFDATPAELADALTMAGIEVEGIETVGSDCAGIVVAEIVALSPHPDASGLRVCRVNDGQRELQVVCGAANFTVGDKAPLAAAGVVLPNGAAIRDSEIRGVASQGMLCAEDELGLSDDHSGLLVLPRELAAGTPFSQVAGPPETVLELEVTWNRPDCLSVLGIAREIAAVYNRPLRRPAAAFEERGEPVEALVSVDLEDAGGCPRYTARVLTDVKIGPSPLWMRRRLALCGVRPISNVVDVTNYVLLECGHPLHAFDYDLLEGHAIHVRRGRAGEKMTTLDGAARDVAGLLVIADARRPVALAGVMGGEGSGIRDATARVLLESACFHPPDIHETSSALSLSTESSYRFERGVDVGGVEWASRRAASLMVELAGAVAARGVVDAFPRPPAERRVRCRYDRARALLGMDVPDGEIAAAIERLGMEVRSRDAHSCTVAAPTFRGDVELEADLIEEVARLHGLDKVPAPLPLCRAVPGLEDEAAAQALTALRANLAALGLNETMNYSFVSPQSLADAPADDPETVVELPNPVSEDQSLLRPSLLPQIASVIGANVARQTADLRLFEIGRVFRRSEDGGIEEETRVCVGLAGKAGRLGPDVRRPVEPEEAFLWIKGIVEALAAAQRVDNLRFLPGEHPCLEKGMALAVLFGDEPCGMLGLLKAEIRRQWRIMEPAAVAELTAAPFLGAASRPPAFRPVPQYPSVVRDVALIVDDGLPHDTVVRAIRDCAPAELTRIALFDTFRGKGIASGRKSLAYSLTYRSMERTLTDEDANRYHDAIKDGLRRTLNAEIREG